MARGRASGQIERRHRTDGEGFYGSCFQLMYSAWDTFSLASLCVHCRNDWRSHAGTGTSGAALFAGPTVLGLKGIAHGATLPP